MDAALAAKVAELHASYRAAVARFEAERSPEAHAAVKAAWAAYDATGTPRKPARFASRAGQRQAAARRAEAGR